jgi:hypothetical protein
MTWSEWEFLHEYAVGAILEFPAGLADRLRILR